MPRYIDADRLRDEVDDTLESGKRLKSLPADIISKLSKAFSVSNEKILEYEYEWRKED